MKKTPEVEEIVVANEQFGNLIFENAKKEWDGITVMYYSYIGEISCYFQNMYIINTDHSYPDCRISMEISPSAPSVSAWSWLW